MVGWFLRRFQNILVFFICVSSKVLGDVDVKNLNLETPCPTTVPAAGGDVQSIQYQTSRFSIQVQQDQS